MLRPALSAIAAIAPLALLASCSDREEGVSTPVLAQEAEAAVSTLTVEKLQGMIARGEVLLVDVRRPDEFGAGRLPGALNAPVETFDPAAIPQEQARETVLYCRSGNRSGRAAEMLAEFTGDTVRHLEGGILAWEAAEAEVIGMSEAEASTN